MMYLKLKGCEFKSAAQAAKAAETVIDYGPTVQCYYRRIPGGNRWEKEVIWTVQVPATRNCSGLIAHLKQRFPLSEWTLYEIDEDGFEVDLQPSISGSDLREAARIPVKT
jgi:hypothetical protein